MKTNETYLDGNFCILKVKVSVCFSPPFFLNSWNYILPRSWHPSHIIAWHIDRETVETVTDNILGSKITTDSDYSHEIKRRLFLGRKTLAKLDNILKSRGITYQQRSV